MTVYFDLDGIVFHVHGVKHEQGGETSFEIHHVHVQGNCGDLRAMLSEDFMERVQDAALEAALSPSGGVFFEQRLPRPLGAELARGLSPFVAGRWLFRFAVEDVGEIRVEEKEVVE
jgi:hypothetical protein